MKCDVKNFEQKSVGSIELPEAVFGVHVRKDILARVIQWQLDKRRAGTHKTKDISEVSGRGAKPYRQKGTGRARLGNVRAPQTRHGGVAFGPVVRSHEYDLNKKIRALGLRMALSQKQAEGKLFVLDTLAVEDVKTKAMQAIFDKNGWKSVLFVDGESLNDKFMLSIQNIVGADALPTIGANVYDVVRHETLVLSKEAVAQLEGRLK